MHCKMRGLASFAMNYKQRGRNYKTKYSVVLNRRSTGIVQYGRLSTGMVGIVQALQTCKYRTSIVPE